jgi:hypothetical protein
MPFHTERQRVSVSSGAQGIGKEIPKSVFLFVLPKA